MKKIILLITLVTILVPYFIYQICILSDKCFGYYATIEHLSKLKKKTIQSDNNGIAKKGLLNFHGQISCGPIHPEVLLYNRIFKTGSTSISKYIEEVVNNTDISLKIGSTEDWFKTGDPWPYPDHIEKYANKPERFVFTAHFFFRRKLIIQRPFTYINIFREPVDRVVSHYFYMRNEEIRPKHRITEIKKSGLWNETLLECVRHQHRGCEDNVMTRFVCGVPKFCKIGSAKALKRAKRNLLNYYAVVGVLEEIDVFLKMLNKRLPSFFVRSHQTLPKAKRNALKSELSISPDVLDLIRNRNHADIELYEFAKVVFKKQKALCGL